MAHHGGKSTTKLGRDSISKRLGVKLYSGQKVCPGNIIIRQRGTKFICGENVKRTADDSLIALKNGVIAFTTKHKKRFDGTMRRVKVVHVRAE